MIPVTVEIFPAGSKKETWYNLYELPALIGIGSSSSWASSPQDPSGNYRIPYSPIYCNNLSEIENWFGDKISGTELKGENGFKYPLYTSASDIWGTEGLGNFPIVCVQVEGSIYSESNLSSAFNSLITEPISSVLIANYYEGESEEDLISLLNNFVNEHGGSFGIYMLSYGSLLPKNKNYTNLVPVAHKRINSNDDCAAIFLGGILRRRPWEGGNFQPIRNFEMRNFDSDEMISLENGKVNYPIQLNDGTIWMSENYLQGPIQFLDHKRILDYIIFRINLFLNSSEVLGNLKINRIGLIKIKQTILTSVSQILASNRITNFLINIPALNAIETNDKELISYYQNTRKIDVLISFQVDQNVHQIQFNLNIS